MMLVSIIIPIYNAESYLEDCLKSVKKQTFTNIEVICVNDGSSDGSKKIIENFVEVDKRFIYVEKKHSNAGEARNIGLNMAKGDFLLFLDSDDCFEPGLVGNVIETAIQTKADVTVFQYKLFDDNTGKLSKRSYGIHTNRRRPFGLFELKERRFDFTNIAVWNKMYKTDFVKNNNLMFKSHPAINDVFFSWTSLICARKIGLCRYVGTYYRINTGQSVSDNLERTSACFLKAFEEVNDFVKTIGKWDDLGGDLLSVERRQAEEFLSKLQKNTQLCDVENKFRDKLRIFMNEGIS